MAENDDERRLDRKIDLLYRNLDHVSRAYFAVEGMFPYWETVFALIIGQLFIAYFSACPTQGYLLALLGFFLSVIWLILVSLNLKNAQHMDYEIEELHDQLEDLIRSAHSLDFRKPWPEVKDMKNWHWISNILSGAEPLQPKNADIGPKPEKESIKDRFFRISKSTWLYRRVLPAILCISWAWFINYILAVAISIFIILLIIIYLIHDTKSQRIVA